MVLIVLVLVVVLVFEKRFLPRFVSDRRLRLSAKIHSEDRSQPSCQYPSFEDEDDDEDDYDPLQSYPSSSNLLAPCSFRLPFVRSRLLRW
jgi:hypothetical protein